MPDSNRVWADRARLQGTVDFSMMFAAHDAFSRDLDRLLQARDEDRLLTPPAIAVWRRFRRFLHDHHTAEDDALWPPLRKRLSDTADIAIMDAMEAEHATIEPLFDRIATGLGDGDRSTAAAGLQELAANLNAHMRHEERAALPLVETHLGPAGWAAFARAARKTAGLRGAPAYLTWLLDDAPATTKGVVLGQLPLPARLIYRNVWEPRYRRRNPAAA